LEFAGNCFEDGADLFRVIACECFGNRDHTFVCLLLYCPRTIPKKRQSRNNC
jgi:hypothetical protein